MTENLFALTTQNISMLFLAAVVGTALSVFYFGGLWLTLQKINQAKAPALLLAGSFLVRTTVLLMGFYLVFGSGLDKLIVCFICFLATRHFILTWAQMPVRKEKPSHGL
jgi:F1F0 ATPase subunit 2